MKSTSKALLIASLFLMIIGPVLVFCTNFVMIAFAEFPSRSLGLDLFEVLSTLGLIGVLMIISIIGGIVGLVRWRNPHSKFHLVLGLGITILICNTVQLVCYFIGDLRGLAVFCWLLNSAIPVWYMAAARGLRRHTSRLAPAAIASSLEDQPAAQLKEQHYRELEAHQSEIRAMKHDLKNQFIAIHSYVQTGSAKRAGEQLNTLVTQLRESGKYVFTQHAVVNGLLAEKYRQAEAENILCEFHISLPQEAGIADPDLASLVGNILDNALEACRYCDGGRYIRLDIVCQNGLFILKSKNSTDGLVNTTQTRKKDSIRHGIGMANIRRVVEKYSGEMQHQFAAGHFELELTLFCRTVYCSEGNPMLL